MENTVALIIIVAILTLAAVYIVRQKKKGKKCIGCPYANACNKKCNK